MKLGAVKQDIKNPSKTVIDLRSRLSGQDDDFIRDLEALRHKNPSERTGNPVTSFKWRTTGVPDRIVLLYNNEAVAYLDYAKGYARLSIYHGGEHGYRAASLGLAKTKAISLVRNEFPQYRAYKQSQPTLAYVNKVISKDAIARYGKVIRIEPMPFDTTMYRLTFESGYQLETKIPKQRSNPHGFAIVDEHLNVIAKGKDFDKLQDRVDRHNEDSDNKWFVVDEGDLKEGVKKNPMNPAETDREAAKELWLFANNDANLHRQQIEPIRKNLITKQARGVYKTELAIKLAMYLMENAAKKYAREFGGTWNEIFNVPTRREAARLFIEDFEADARDGDFDYLLPKKYQKNGNDLSENPELRAGMRVGRRHLFNNNQYAVYPVVDRNGDIQWFVKDVEKLTDWRHGIIRQQSTFQAAVQGLEDAPSKYKFDLKKEIANTRRRKNDLSENPEVNYRIWNKRNKRWETPRIFETKSDAQDEIESYLKSGLIDFRTGKKYTKASFQIVSKLARNHSADDFKQAIKSTIKQNSEMFQGVASGKSQRVLASDLMPKGQSRLGTLAQLKIRNNGKIDTIDFDNDAFLSIDHRKNLWISGKGSILEGVKRPSKGNLLYLGDLIQIDYITAKEHIEDGQLVRFWHRLGEVDRQYPKLFLDSDGFLIINGGGYDVWDVGIVN